MKPVFQTGSGTILSPENLNEYGGDLNLNSPQLAAGIGILAFRQLSGIAAFHKIVIRFHYGVSY